MSRCQLAQGDLTQVDDPSFVDHKTAAYAPFEETTAFAPLDDTTAYAQAADDATSIRSVAVPPVVRAAPAPTAPPTMASQEFATPAPVVDGFFPAPGQRLGKYELRGKLAQGTFGLVYTARDTNLDREVAIKVLNPAHIANRDIVHRFLQEARATARITHPGIVTMLDCGQFETGAYIAMELLQGESLTMRISRSGRLAPSVAIEITRQIASAIDAAHRADILHRDLKPDNIYLVPDPAMPSGERVKVLDFGLAKIGHTGQTQINSVFGTPRYMSPEQCRSAANVDQRSDVYALGCILFELVTGRAPFDGDLKELIERQQRAPVPRAGAFAPECSLQLENLIQDMLAKDPAARPQTMAAVVRILQTHGAVTPGVDATIMPMPAQLVALAPTAQSPIEHAPPAYVPEATAWPRMRRAPIIAAAIAFVVAGALTAVAARGPSTSLPPARPALPSSGS